MELNPLIEANADSVKATAKNEEVKVGVVVDFVSIGNIIAPPDIGYDKNAKALTLIYPYFGVTNAAVIRKYVEFDKFSDLPTQYLTTTVIFNEQPQGGGVPYSDSGSHTTAVPPDENNVAGKANDE